MPCFDIIIENIQRAYYIIINMKLVFTLCYKPKYHMPLLITNA